ncbi:MAG: TrkA family potassium uptake protein [Actinobacteria bacterium]|nr:TrkA family potassium uptake protein [Actinomycetota bacterium]MCB8996731.1 TrkA family potassium uptake protein [Actinomycetota bacterium]MCB9415080.1 TrkA family potassium uptake protein [Actinomycetota bacterium]MCB9425126.1 TrkA family potassium uptake protein [Actinomycetota bacterium]HRY09855.1 TrkA family potassium uptake protein [Candidatus Nanopelagicales bacterium]
MARKSEPVLVIGCGRFGIALARELVRNGTEVLAMDASETTVQRLAGMIENIVVADGTDLEALEELGAADFHTAVVAVGNLEASTLATSNLAQLGVERIWAKALSKQHALILERVGAHNVVQPEHDMGQRLAHLVSGEVLDYLRVADNWVIAKTKPPRFLVGVPLGESHLRKDHRITVIAVKPEGGQMFTHADSQTHLAYGDEILVMGTTRDVTRFAELP